MDRLLTADELAERLGMKTEWVWAQARAGRIPHVRLGRHGRLAHNQELYQLSYAHRAGDESTSAARPFEAQGVGAHDCRTSGPHEGTNPGRTRICEPPLRRPSRRLRFPVFTDVGSVKCLY